MYCLCFLLGCVPNFLVHTGGFLAIVFRHSSNGKNFAAIRVGQQALQGSHPAPSACLRCLHDTHLESANVPAAGPPVCRLPFRHLSGTLPNTLPRRPPPCVLSRLNKIS